MNDGNVSQETKALCAFFAKRYRERTGRDLDSVLLITDHMLTLWLVRVESREDDQKNTLIELKMLNQVTVGSKEGEALPDKYFREVIKAGVGKEDAFQKEGTILEAEIGKQFREIGAMFTDCTPCALRELDTEFTVIPYGSSQVEISYAMLSEVYDRVIRTPLAEGIEKIKTSLERKRISFQNRTGDSFKLCFSGVFGSFELVRRQIETAFSLSSHDKRREYFFVDPGECQRAALIGERLLADGRAVVGRKAPYSIGVFEPGSLRKNYAVTIGQTITGRAYYPQSHKDGSILVSCLSSKAVNQFIVNEGEEAQTARIRRLKPKWEQILQEVWPLEFPMAAMGFSIDEEDVPWLHIREFDFMEDALGEREVVKKLTNLAGLFEEEEGVTDEI